MKWAGQEPGQGRGPHSPTQGQLAQAPHATSPKHVLLRACPVQHGPKAERHVRAPARGAHLWKGQGHLGRAETPGRVGHWGRACEGQVVFRDEGRAGFLTCRVRVPAQCRALCSPLRSSASLIGRTLGPGGRADGPS